MKKVIVLHIMLMSIIFLSTRAYTTEYSDCLIAVHTDVETERIYFEATHLNPEGWCEDYCDHNLRPYGIYTPGDIYVEIWCGNNYVDTVKLDEVCWWDFCETAVCGDKVIEYPSGNYEARYYHKGFEGDPYYCSVISYFHID